MKLPWFALAFVWIGACSGGNNPDAAGQDSGVDTVSRDTTPSDTSAPDVAMDVGSDASDTMPDTGPADTASTDAGPTDAGDLITQCQSLASMRATLCAGDAARSCIWNAYRQLCLSGNAQLLIDSMRCLDTACRTFSDSSGGEACLGTVHPSEESSSEHSAFTGFCGACGGTSCAAGEAVGEVVTYLSDSDANALAACEPGVADSGMCGFNQLVVGCSAVPGVALFTSCAGL